MSHTKTKLHVGKKYATDIYSERAGHAIARTVNPQTTGEDEENARRLVACWNACIDQSTENLDADFDQGYSPWAHVAEIEAQRDDLLRELTNATPPHPGCGSTVGECVASNSCGCSMGAAIKKAEGKV